ncbi:UNVERIFIED_CONTAM: Retrovirus-related Pol polyprotein from transposon TNT 1-94 [Sesamum latifolium]|uniref:Retrovirus-related Pol polyprotein from transposon TNT 1-94 n=1 Tax=Sesamum latifolium TaxID=2727402 RepID=A0AAW2Y9Q8_9LAMI
MMSACIAKKRGIGRGSAHNSSPTQVLKRSRRLSKDWMILRLSDWNAVAVVCRYPKETTGYYFYDLSEKKVFISRNAVFLEKNFPKDSRRDEVLLEETNEAPQQNDATSFEPMVSTDSVPVLRRSTRESRPPDRYGFLELTSQLDNDPRTYREAISDIDLDKWLEAMRSEMDSMGSNQVWTLIDLPKGVKPVGCKWVYKPKFGADEEVTAFKARLVAKGYTK